MQLIKPRVVMIEIREYKRDCTIKWEINGNYRSLQPEALLHQALQARLVDEVPGEFLAGKHGQGGAPRARHQFRCFLYGQAGVLRDGGHDHADHPLQTADPIGFFSNLFRGLPLSRVR